MIAAFPASFIKISECHLNASMVAVLIHGDVVHEGKVLLPVHIVQQQQLVLQLVQHDLENWKNSL